MSKLGRLQHVDLNEAWANEATDFTPWLAQDENITLLGDTIGIELEVQATEKEVGRFRADILCKETASSTWVLVENQLGKTDHGHLGQLLTYAAGLDAVIIIWIAAKFRDEHRAALDWFNEITGESTSFFGLEIELWRIGDSPFAPKFNVVCKPNDWAQRVKGETTSGDLSEVQQTQFDFWTEFKEYMDEGSFIRCSKPAPQNWMEMAVGRTGFGLSAIANTWDSQDGKNPGVLRAEFVVHHKPHAKVIFAQLETEKEAIEKEFGEPLDWYNPSNARVCRALVRNPVDIKIRENWPEYFDWLRTKLETLHEVFQPRVKNIDLGQFDASEESEENEPA